MADNIVINTGEKGEVNTASNVGTGGVGLYKQKLNDNLEFKNVNQTSSEKVTITEDVLTNEVRLDVNEDKFDVRYRRNFFLMGG